MTLVFQHFRRLKTIFRMHQNEIYGLYPLGITEMEEDTLTDDLVVDISDSEKETEKRINDQFKITQY